MFTEIHRKKRLQLVVGLVAGILFGFLLQKGGVTKYNVIIAQLLLEDFTVVKIMLTAVITGMIGVHALKSFGLAELHPKPGSVGSTVIGGLVFGAGFGILGYCPGTVAGAVGNGYLDALFGGVTGMLLGAGLFAVIYPSLEKGVLKMGTFSSLTLPELFKVNPWAVVVPVAAALVALLVVLELAGL
ncbi:MAG: YeeE/YedE thiosulfate transporter family protein [Planctomycetota bacterium]